MMSDEHDAQVDDSEQDGDTPQLDGEVTDTTADVPPPADEEDGGDVTGGDEPAPAESAAIRWSRPILNMQIGGRLTLHHQIRDVTLIVDGDSAMRAIEYFARREGRGDLDHLSSKFSSAEFGWVSLNLTGVIGMSWKPGFDDDAVEDRLTFDPMVPAA